MHIKTIAAAVVATSMMTMSPAEAGPQADGNVGTAHERSDATVSIAQKYTRDYANANLEVGVTTRDEVLAKFGKPTKRETSSSGETLVYQREDDGARGTLKMAGRLLRAAGSFLPNRNTAVDAAATKARHGTRQAEDAMRAADEVGNLGGERISRIYLVLNDGVVNYISIN